MKMGPSSTSLFVDWTSSYSTSASYRMVPLSNILSQNAVVSSSLYKRRLIKLSLVNNNQNPFKTLHLSTPQLSLSTGTASTNLECSAKIIDGKLTAKKIRDEIRIDISRMKEAIGVVPGLAVVLVGDRKDSATYVRNKKKACEEVGIKSYEAHLPENTTEEEVLKYIYGFNDDPSVHGILVQLPLPSVNSNI